MNRRQFVVAASALALSGCDTPPVSVSQRLTLSVKTPDGIFTGSSVTKQTTVFQDGWLGGMANHSLLSFLRGEALFLDLASRGHLIVLLRYDENRPGSQSIESLTEKLFSQEYEAAERASGTSAVQRYTIFFHRLADAMLSVDVPAAYLPLMVRFRDLADPRTVERVDPLDLTKSFGAGVEIAKATFAIVDAPLTTGIEQKLPWLRKPNRLDAIVEDPEPSRPAGTRRALMHALDYEAFKEPFP